MPRCRGMRCPVFLFCLTLLLQTGVPILHADGMAMKYRVYDRAGRDRYKLQQENSQSGVILYREGVEHLLLAVGLEDDAQMQDAQSVWLFPIQGTDPNAVVLDLVDQFPTFYGTDPRRKMMQRIDEAVGAAYATQIWSSCLLPSLGSFRSRNVNPLGVGIGAMVERYGMHSEVVRAESLEALAAHLNSQGMQADVGSLSTLSDYVAGEYLLVLTWITSPNEFRAHFGDLGLPNEVKSLAWPCVYVAFPTDEMFFPMKPTSVYGEVRVELDLVILDHVKSVVADEALDKKLRTQHYEMASEKLDLPLGMAEALAVDSVSGEMVRYTRITSSSKAMYFAEDLVFVSAPQEGWAAASLLSGFLNSHQWVRLLVNILFVSLVSYLVAGLSGLLVFRRWRGYACLGLFNMLTILVFLYCTMSILKERQAAADPGNDEPHASPPPPPRPQPPVRSFRIAWPEGSDPTDPAIRAKTTHAAAFCATFFALMLVVPFVIGMVLKMPFS